MAMQTTIYFDMDGVLVNLDAALTASLGQDIREVAPEHLPTSDAFVKDLIRKNLKNRVFAVAPPAVDFLKFKVLMYRLQDNQSFKVEILSSCMEPASFDEIRRQKAEWLNHFGLGGFKRNFTVSGAAKAYWADPHSVLIDDMKSNCEKFKKAGGRAVNYQYGQFDVCRRHLFATLRIS